MDEAAEEMVTTALSLKNYPDNISVNVIWYLGEDAGSAQEKEEEDDA